MLTNDKAQIAPRLMMQALDKWRSDRSVRMKDYFKHTGFADNERQRIMTACDVTS